MTSLQLLQAASAVNVLTDPAALESAGAPPSLSLSFFVMIFCPHSVWVGVEIKS